MSVREAAGEPANISTFDEFAKTADYSLMDTLNPDPDATEDGNDFAPRQVFSGHYVPVKPSPIADPVYISHSQQFFRELGLDDSLVLSEGFAKLFSGDITDVPAPMRKVGWATGYALSILVMNILSNAHLEPVTVMVMVVRSRCLKVCSTTSDGKCS